MHHCAVLHLNFSRYRISANEPLNVSATALEKKYSYYQQIAQLLSLFLSLVSCLLSPVICPSPPVPRLLSHVSCLTSPVSRLLPSPFVPCFLSLASCPTSSFTLVLSHMSCLTSPVSCLQSHVSCLKSHVTCHLSHVSCLCKRTNRFGPMNITRWSTTISPNNEWPQRNWFPSCCHQTKQFSLKFRFVITCP